MIRHLTSNNNVNNGEVIDPFKIKHGIVTALKISQLSGWVEPQTHLNIDFPRHLMKEVYVAESLSVGSRIILNNGRFMTAFVNNKDYQHFGAVNELEKVERLKQRYRQNSPK